VVSLNNILDHVVNDPFIELGMVRLCVPGMTEGQCGQSLTFVFGIFDELGVSVLTDTFLLLK
jgi:hypothetical protein